MKQNNKLCKCGSGKKYKKYCGRKIPRKTVIDFDMGHPVLITEIRQNPFTDELEFYSFGTRVIPKSTNVSYSYEKSGGNKDKILTKQFKNEKVYLSLPVRSISDYDIIYAIDTNYRIENGIKLCASGITRSTSMKVIVPKHTGVYIIPKYCFSFMSSLDKPENQAWKELINRISLWEDVSDKSIGIMVDSDLGNLEKYNNREIPFHDDHFLPNNMSFIYASGERDSDNPMNKMIKIADSLAGFLLERFVEKQRAYWEIMCFNDIKIWSVEHNISENKIKLRSV